MGADVRGLVGRAAIHQCHGVVDLVGVGESVPRAIGIRLGAEGGVEGVSRVEGFLHIVDGGFVLLDVAEHAHVDSQSVVEHALVHVHVARQVA